MVSLSDSVKHARREDATTPAAPCTIQGDWEPDPGREFRGLCKIFLVTSARRCPGPGIQDSLPTRRPLPGRWTKLGPRDGLRLRISVSFEWARLLESCLY